MEMTYGGALVMPSSYAMMDEDEMEYLNGGGVHVMAAKIGIYALFAAVGIGTGLIAAQTLRAQGGKYLAKKSIDQLGVKLGLKMTIGAVVVSQLVDFIVNVCDPIGWLLGKLDKLDGSVDDWIGGKGLTTWTALSLKNW